MLFPSFQLFAHVYLSTSMEFQNKLINIYQNGYLYFESYYIDDAPYR
jgi:hypothetical protein